jgi:threonylcarbamoyladenosine tRNA methylthiotransferase MtaB
MKVFFDSIGCRLNQSEIEKYASQFRSAGHEIVRDAAEADLVVVNPGAVPAQAASDSRQKIRQASRAGGAEVIVTGCWSTLEPQQALALPGVSQVVPNLDKDRLVAEVLGLPVEVFDLEPIARQPLPGAHLRTRAFIKVQDGCDNHCTFCITRVARGAGRSRGVEQVLADVNAAIQGGAREIVFTGVHLGSWGQDFAQPLHLRNLIETTLAESDAPRLRLSSLEPWDLDEDFFRLWENPRLCRHLHLPLQSGCEATLRRMARKVTPESFAGLARAARSAAADMAITTDIIVGFPGESVEEFRQSLGFVEAMQFAAGHVFNYSARPGTPAARLPQQVAAPVRKARSAEMRAVVAESSQRYRAAFLGSQQGVLWEGAAAQPGGGFRLEGLTGNYLRVSAWCDSARWNQIDRVRLVDLTADGLQGEICEDGAG